MIKINKVNIKIIDNQTQLGNSRLEFKISGDNINYIVVNTIRRVILSDIPIYAFNEFKFDKNNSVFHNNYLKLRLRNMPIWNIDNQIDYFENHKKDDIIKETVEEYEEDDVELDVDKTLKSSTLKQLTMYINYKNKTENIVTVTTDDAKFYYDQKQMSTPYNVSIPIVKLQPKQEIIFSAITNIGTETIDAMYSAVCVAAYKQKNDNEFDFFLESRGQVTEKRILEVALINIERKLSNFIKLINEKTFDDNELEGIIIVNNEDHTIGNLISRGMQMNDNIDFAGYNLPHPLANKVHLHYKLNKGNIKKIIQDVVDYYIKLFSEIKKNII